jgi:hypothetical protein
MTDGAIRPFTIQLPEDAVDDMRRRIAATRWPERETVDDDSQGVPLAMMQELADHWASDYNRLDRGGHFAACEQPQVLAEKLRASFRSLR